MRILYLTDFEGSRKFFDAINMSQIVSSNSSSGLRFRNHDHSHFIYGGDATDRGNHDLTILEMLVDFKKRHPDRVTLLSGNREIKNSRFHIELTPNLIKQRLLFTTQPRWLKQPTLPLDYVKNNMNSAGLSITQTNIESYVASLSIKECQQIYLKWMLEKTMGCPNTFRYRGEELSKRMQKNVTDEEVLESFLKEAAPTGVMGEYLQHSQVGVIIPSTKLLAVHGGLTSANIGRLPNMAPSDPPIDNAAIWIDKFNQWYKQQIHHWTRFTPQVLTEPACTELDDSALPMPNKIKFVMTADMLNSDRSFAEIPNDVEEYLNKNNLTLVLTGHQPCGDHPALLRSPSDRVLFLNGDTGYADVHPQNPDDTRGMTNHIVDITTNLQQTKISVEATLVDGTPVKTQLMITANNIEGDQFIGKLLPDKNLVQCKLPDGNYRLIKQEGFKVTYSTIGSKELALKLDATNRHKSSIQATTCPS